MTSKLQAVIFWRNSCCIIAVVSVIGGCGGGSSSSTTPPTPVAANPPPIRFVEISQQAGFSYSHGLVEQPLTEPLYISGGVAAGDYNDDGLIDLYVVAGSTGSNLLFQNQGGNSFRDVTGAAGVGISGEPSAGPMFADTDGDGDLDLFVGAVGGHPVRLFENNGDGTFSDITSLSGLSLVTPNTFSAAFGDYDGDGWLDLFLAHWDQQTVASDDTGNLWRNEGNNVFTNKSIQSGIAAAIRGAHKTRGNTDYTFSPIFADINNDGYLDILVASDFVTSRVFLNNGDGGISGEYTFTDVTDPAVITDTNGMGASVGDYDNDGDLDWFVTSIFSSNENEAREQVRGADVKDGNRLYRNNGDGSFEDVTTEAGVRQGDWGWGSCFADFDSDGYLDIFHVNGWSDGTVSDRSRLFLSNGADGTFSEVSRDVGIDDYDHGRGVVCADTDNDGDIDIFVANNSGPPVFYRNDGGNTGNYLAVELVGTSPNTQAIGARITVSAGGIDQLRELTAGSNFSSNNPPIQHFGLGAVTLVDEIAVTWPDGQQTILRGVAVNQRLELDHPDL